MYKKEDIKDILNDYFYDDMYDEISDIIEHSGQDVLFDKFEQLVEYSDLDFVDIREVIDIKCQVVDSEIEISGKAWVDIGLDGYAYFEDEDIILESAQTELIIEFVFYADKYEEQYNSFSITNIYI